MIHLRRAWPAAILAVFLFSSLRAAATITVISDWRLGESDPTAIAGTAAFTTSDYVGGGQLVFQGNSTYSSDVGFAAAARSGSLLSVNFTNAAYASNSIVSALNNNFGIEAWVKPESSGDGVILYNGRTDTTGWGFTLQTIGTQRYSVIYGGVDVFGSYPATNGVWAHLALVCSNGISTFYVNGILVATRTEIPNVPTGNFALACAPQVPGSEAFTGLIDEVRFFTFSANSFSTADLLLNSPIEKIEPLPATQITASNALLNGAVTPGGVSTSGWLEWGLTTGYGNSNAPVLLGNGQTPVAISNQLTGLQPGHAYHFRSVATNSSGIFRSWDQTFVTPIINLTTTSQTNYVHVPLTTSATLAATPLLLSANDGPNGIVLKADGTVSVWGDDTYGQTNFASSLSNIIGVAAGDFHFVALRRDGTVVSWGKNTVGQTNTPAGLDNVIFVAAGGDRSMAVRRDGSLTNWGNPLSFGATNIVQVSGSLGAAVALTADGTILGGSPPANATNVISIVCGAGHVMVLRADGNVVAWGNNGSGQTNVPSGVTNVAAISACGNGSMALMRDGSVIAWGSNDGNKNTVPPSVTNVVAIATAGASNFAMRKDGVVIGWGSTASGQTAAPGGLTNITGIINLSGSVNTNAPGVYPFNYTTTNYLGAINSAAASLTLLSPTLTLTPGIGATATLSWPSNATGYILQQTVLINSNGWTAASSGVTNPVIITTTNSALFYRLTHP